MAKQEEAEESRMATQEAEAELKVDASLGQKRVRQQKHLFSGQDGHDDTKTTPPFPRAAAHTKACDTSKAHQPDKRPCPRPARAESNQAIGGIEQQHGVLDSCDTSGTDPAYTAHGAKCEVWSEGDWWSAHVVMRRNNMLRISYVGGTDDEDEWLLASEWPNKMRAPVPDEEDAHDTRLIMQYRGVERFSNGTFPCVADALEVPRQDVASSLEGPQAEGSGLEDPLGTDRQLLRERFNVSQHHVNACSTLALPARVSGGLSGGLSHDPLETASKRGFPALSISHCEVERTNCQHPGHVSSVSVSVVHVCEFFCGFRVCVCVCVCVCVSEGVYVCVRVSGCT